jgi:vanillate O-demethylase ferredoxin subunit
LSAASLAIQIACEEGVCGSCLTRVLEGVPDYKDKYLTPEDQAARDQFLPWRSHAKTTYLLHDL